MQATCSGNLLEAKFLLQVFACFVAAPVDQRILRRMPIHFAAISEEERRLLPVSVLDMDGKAHD